MDYFPIFVQTSGVRIALAGGGLEALAKLRLLLKTQAQIMVFSPQPDAQIIAWAQAGKLHLTRRDVRAGDVQGAVLFYAATGDEAQDARLGTLARADGALVNLVDNLQDSAFITPAIVDRDPVVVAIGTEGAAPVLARGIKHDLEQRLPSTLGPLARIAKGFRAMAEAVPAGALRRNFWHDFFDHIGPRAIAKGEAHVRPALGALRDDYTARGAGAGAGHVAFVGAGPGDPDLLTMQARRALDSADVVIYDRLVSLPILELARREALMIDVGKEGFGPSTAQETIHELMIKHTAQGAKIVRLKSGDPTVFGRLDEEIDALSAHDISWHIVPGITCASAAVAHLGQSLTRRGRNAGVRLLTGHDMQGFADHDWAAMARPGEVAAVYMGKRAARYIQGRLMMHGADPATPVTLIENVSRPDQRVLATCIADMGAAISDFSAKGPALVFIGLPPRTATSPKIENAPQHATHL